MDFEDMKRFAAEKFNDLASKTKEFAKTAADITVTTAKITKLKAELASDRNELKKQFEALGEKFYEEYCENAPEGYEELFSNITVSLGVIQAKADEIDELSESDESGKELYNDVKAKVNTAYDIVKDKVYDVVDDIKAATDSEIPNEYEDCDDDDIEVEFYEEEPKNDDSEN